MRRHDVGMAFEQIAYPARRALLVKTGVARRDIGFGGRELARPLLVLGGFEPDRVVRQDDRLLYRLFAIGGGFGPLGRGARPGARATPPTACRAATAADRDCVVS